MHESLRPDVHYMKTCSRFGDHIGLNDLVTKGKVKVERGSISEFTENGVIINGKEIELDVVIAATGY
eukprot:CAMPEP_0168313198 /NCGR_PEP_ID=MMETSP0210-20121227/366_1 /TAXON_ID=40633 /ORGANISM="Condylostoma magnum, Strain COL2" /LENGTH=66 /DNA_ID=CAMNT_0008266845 /DNA_START=875 /DNA_END=1075 /DNA_ORIENTATION=-